MSGLITGISGVRVMLYDDFIDRVGALGDLDRAEAETATQGFFEALDERLTPAEASALASRLPAELSAFLGQRRKGALSYPAAAFFARIGERQRLDSRAARERALAVWAALREALRPWELMVVRARLPRELAVQVR